MSAKALQKSQKGHTSKWLRWSIGVVFVCWLAIQVNLLGTLLRTTTDDSVHDGIASLKNTVVVPPRPQYEWGNNTNNDTIGIQFQPLLDVLVQIDQSPESFTDVVPLVIRNGNLFHSSVKTKALNHKYPGVRGRYPGRVFHAEDMIREAIRIGLEWMDREPRFRAVVVGDGLPLLLRHGDDPGCGDDDPSTATMARNDDDDNNKDTMSSLSPSPIPYLSWCTHVDCHYSWPIVSYNLWERYANPMKYGTVMQNDDDWQRQFASQNWWYPWKSKIQKAVWRGSPTGWLHYNKEDFHTLPRVQLVRLGMQYPDLVDAAFTNTAQIHPDRVQKFRNEMRMASRTILERQQRYRAIIDIDGNTWSARFGEQLCLNSVTIKIQPSWVNSFHKNLEPWVHYVPANMSNLIEMVQYVISDNQHDEMQRIVQNANKWCQTYMTRRQMAIDTLWLLVSYAELLDKANPDWRKVWNINNATAYHLPNLEMTNVEQTHAKWKAIGRRRKRWFPFL